MKIGIITFHFAYNYGAVLQSYALCSYLRGKGFDAQIIDYFPDDLKHLYTLNPLIANRKKEIIKKAIKLPKCRNQFQYFEKFKSDYMNCSKAVKKEDLAKLNDEYSLFITGSDQVWNGKIVEDLKPYFLTFVNQTNMKMSYAASFGKSTFITSDIEKYLSSFSAISVREESASRLLLEKGIQCTVVADPVFLLKSSEWLKLCRKSACPKDYLLYYSLEYDTALEKCARELSEQKKLATVVIHPTCEKICTINGAIFKYDVGPMEFLYLIQNANCVVTNSFHATAFSLLFNKEFKNISSKDRMERVLNLLHALGYNMSSSDCCIHLKMNDINPQNIEKIRKNAQSFLQNSIGGKIP